ncbi:MAG: hypothetical protein IPK80_16110 [Nannocystis sp.]|nr:hypothetical protein [Nannocystis sp.]
MGSEPITFRLRKEGDFDGLTKMQQRRSNFQIVTGRVYELDLTGPAGQIDGESSAFFPDVTPKLIGVASSNWNPQNVARMLAKDNPDIFREEVDLTPHMAYLVMYPGDTLAIRTQDGGRVCVQIVVTELAESEHVSLALGTPPEPQWRRFRLIRDLSGGFSHLPLNNTYSPPFHWDPGLSMLVTNAIGDGPIPARDLCMYPTFQGCYVSVRYAGINADAQLHIVDGVLRDSAPLQTDIKPMRWSKVHFVSHDDLLGLWSPAPVGSAVVCDIELVRVQPGDRLSGRYANDL